MSDHSNGYSPYGTADYQNAGQGQYAQYAQPQYAQPQYAQPQYAQPQYAQPQYAQQDASPRAAAAAPAPGTGLTAWFNVKDPAYLKGLLLGAGAALVLTNPTVQKALVGGAVRVWAAVQGGIEEIKEQIEDVKAELSRED